MNQKNHSELNQKMNQKLRAYFVIIFGSPEASGVDLGLMFDQLLSQFGGSVRLWGASLEREPYGAEQGRITIPRSLKL